jgi:hypothetical protein
MRRGPAAAHVELADGRCASAVVHRIGGRPVHDILVFRLEPEPRPPPLPALRAAHAPRPGLRVDLAALAAALLPPVERAATAAGLLRLSSPAASPRAGVARPRDELGRLEVELAEIERRLRWLQASGRELAGRAGPVDLAALVSELVGSAPPGHGRVRTQLAPARAHADAGRLRTALREILRAAADAVPAGGELLVRVAARSGAAVLELVPAAAAAEAVALARTFLVPEGGEVELEVPPGRAGVCRILLPAS